MAILIGTQNKSFRYFYDLKDHLGNTRAEFESGTSIYNARVTQSTAYYPFGLAIQALTFNEPTPTYQTNRYTYNNKENQPELGLQWLDYGARMYDAQVGRWWSVDPLAEKGRRWSPYVYGFNNPIRFVDPDGMWPDDPTNPLQPIYSFASYAEYQVNDAINTVSNTLSAIGDAIGSIGNSIGSVIKPVDDHISKVNSTPIIVNEPYALQPPTSTDLPIGTFDGNTNPVVSVKKYQDIPIDGSKSTNTSNNSDGKTSSNTKNTSSRKDVDSYKNRVGDSVVTRKMTFGKSHGANDGQLFITSNKTNKGRPLSQDEFLKFPTKK